MYLTLFPNWYFSGFISTLSTLNKIGVKKGRKISLTNMSAKCLPFSLKKVVMWFFYLICRGTEVIHEHLAINIFNGDPYPQLNFCPQSYSINQYQWCSLWFHCTLWTILLLGIKEMCLGCILILRFNNRGSNIDFNEKWFVYECAHLCFSVHQFPVHAIVQSSSSGCYSTERLSEMVQTMAIVIRGQWLTA